MTRSSIIVDKTEPPRAANTWRLLTTTRRGNGKRADLILPEHGNSFCDLEPAFEVPSLTEILEGIEQASLIEDPLRRIASLQALAGEHGVTIEQIKQIAALAMHGGVA